MRGCCAVRLSAYVHTRFHAMQAATAASMADSFNAVPSEGDGFTFEHLADRKEAWVDFIADTVSVTKCGPSLTKDVFLWAGLGHCSGTGRYFLLWAGRKDLLFSRVFIWASNDPVLPPLFMHAPRVMAGTRPTVWPEPWRPPASPSRCRRP